MAIKKTEVENKTKNIKEKNISIIDDKSIKEYADIFSNHNLKLLEVNSNGTKITLKKTDDKVVQNIVQPIANMPIQTAIASQNIVFTEKEEVSDVKETANTNYLDIVSPIVGTFYDSSSPDTPPYVKEGDIVTADTVVCIIEAMKMMNEIKSGINGKIVKKLVDNNTAIEAGVVLFLIEP